MTDRAQVSIYEVGPRDGLQNEHASIPPETKIEFVNALAEAGLSRIEVTSFVRPGAIPQLSDAEAVARGINRPAECRFTALVPNAQGIEKAIACGIPEVAVFTAASESFTRKNINCTIEESFARFADVFRIAQRERMPVRGYVSTVVDCPYEGPVQPNRVAEVARRLLDLGCYEISLGETIGSAVPDDVARLLEAVLPVAPVEKLAGHFHDTRGTALANTARALAFGLRVFDASAGGLGGCPYAPGAAGNLATEDLVYFLERSGFVTGVKLEKVAKASQALLRVLGRPSGSRVHLALEAVEHGERP